MKIIKYLFLLVAVAFSISSCDYLDVVPDEKPSEKDAFEDSNAAERFLYSCYSYLPLSRHGALSLDFMTGDEVVTAFEHETFASFPKGNFSASNTVISYWDTFFQGLKQCYILLNNIDNVPNMDSARKEDYKGQAHFLIAYYHFLLVRCYGPVILIKEEPATDTAPLDYLPRSPFDECVQFVCDKFDEAAALLPVTRVQRQYGLAIRPAAKALKAKMLLYAASPLFNGNSEFYANFKDKEGNPLMPLTYDAGKWTKAKEAYEEAISVCEAAGFGLLTSLAPEFNNYLPNDPTQKLLRFNIMEWGNKEIVWADSRDEDSYGLQNKSIPYSSASGWNGVSPTWVMLNRFYTKNGLPYDEDPKYKNANKLELVTIEGEYAAIGKEGEKTIKFNLDREPRYYAWVAFQNGYYEITSSSTNGAYDKDPTYEAEDGKSGRLVCDFVVGGNCARGPNKENLRGNDYSPTGYLNKKGVHSYNDIATGLRSPRQYPWPIVRMAELYLSYAEACVEANDLPKAKEYLNKVRTRAGVPTVETSWAGVATLDQAKLRSIVRQERQVEMYLENQNFWDMRRWLLAGQAFNKKHQGMTIEATTIEGFSQLQEVIFARTFSTPTQYLLPIPVADVNKNENVVQNPGY